MNNSYPKISNAKVVSCYPANLPATVANQNQTKYVITLELTVDHQNCIQEALNNLKSNETIYNEYSDWPEPSPITRLPIERLKITDLSSSKNNTKSNLEDVLAELSRIKNSL